MNRRDIAADESLRPKIEAALALVKPLARKARSEALIRALEGAVGSLAGALMLLDDEVVNERHLHDRGPLTEGYLKMPPSRFKQRSDHLPRTVADGTRGRSAASDGEPPTSARAPGVVSTSMRRRGHQ